MSETVLICVATAREGDRLADHGEVLVTGVGVVNAAHALTLRLASGGVRAVVSCGIGGAYPGSGLAVGDVACASSECYGDLGAQAPEGFLDMRALGFPVIDGPEPLYNELPLTLFPADRRVPFVTVMTCTGTDEIADALEARTGGGVEGMEGAAIAHVAYLHGIPVGEIRGISNMVGRRDRGNWRVSEAADAAQNALLSWLG